MPELQISQLRQDFMPLQRSRNEMGRAFRHACRMAQPFLPLDHINFTAVCGSDRPQHEGYRPRAVSGQCAGPEEIILRFVPRHPDFRIEMMQNLPYIVAHEANHAHRMAKFGSAQTKGERWVLEGLGVAAEYDVGKGHVPLSYADYRYNEDWLKDALKEASALRDRPRTENSYQFWHAGGYHLGLHFVRNYQRANGNPTAAQLVHTPAAEILKATFG